jgi:hypothetical protein
MQSRWRKILVLGQDNECIRSYILNDDGGHTSHFTRQKRRTFGCPHGFPSTDMSTGDKSGLVTVPKRILLPSIPPTGVLTPLAIPPPGDKKEALYSGENAFASYDCRALIQ